jgi:hypothetical protein
MCRVMKRASALADGVHWDNRTIWFWAPEPPAIPSVRMKSRFGRDYISQAAPDSRHAVGPHWKAERCARNCIDPRRTTPNLSTRCRDCGLGRIVLVNKNRVPRRLPSFLLHNHRRPERREVRTASGTDPQGQSEAFRHGSGLAQPARSAEHT